MNDPRVEKQKPVPPFVQFCCAAIPQVFDDSLSYYEALCAMWKYLDETVKVINNNALVTEDFIAKVEELHDYVENYFANLDVQEEINNKLDEMVEEGTLQEIITTYIQANVAWTFDTVADMKSSTNLIAGSFARTLGFRSANDGGGATYKISDSGVANEMDVIAVGALYANLVLPSIATPEMFGTYGDGVHDDTDYLKRCFAVAKNIKFGKDYVITNRIDVLSGTVVDGNYHTVTNNTAVNFFRADTQKGITFRNLNLIGDDTLSMAQNGINIISSSEVLIENVNIKDTGGDGVAFGSCTNCVLRNAVLSNNLLSAIGYNSNYIVFENVNVYKPRFQFGIQFKSCQHSSMSNIFVDTSKDNSVYISKGAEEEAHDSFDIFLNNITVVNQGAEGTTGSGTQYSLVIAGVEDCKANGIYIKGGLAGVYIVNSPRAAITNGSIEGGYQGIRSLSDNVVISDCVIRNCTSFGIRVESAKYNIITGCKISDCGNSTSTGNIELQSSDECVISNNILEISSGTGEPKVNICTKTAIGKVTITDNNFINPATGNSYFDIGTVWNIDKLVLKNNGWIRLRSFQGITVFPGVIEVNYGNIVIYSRTVTTTPDYSGFKDGSIIYNTTGTGYIGWVINSGTWHTFGEISA